MTPAGGGGDNRLRRPLDEAFAAVPSSWRPVTDAFAVAPAGRRLVETIDARVGAGALVYPATPFRALELTAPDEVRVVVLGQDPYHGPGQAQGLAFSVARGVPPPPSLRNLLREVADDLGAPSRCADGDLTPWAAQGVLLLNGVLTVERAAPAAHAGLGWEALTDALLARVADAPRPVVFMLWGAAAQKKRIVVDRERHLVLAANHPSPLSARRPPVPFLGSRPFGRADRFLAERRPGSPPIRW